MKKLWLPLPLLIFACFILRAETPDMAMLHKLEAQIQSGDFTRLYGGPVPVAAKYARYYTATIQSGKPVILGEWVWPYDSKEKPAGIYPVATRLQFPIIMDGGCSIINFVYDIKANRILSAECNGVA